METADSSFPRFPRDSESQESTVSPLCAILSHDRTHQTLSKGVCEIVVTSRWANRDNFHAKTPQPVFFSTISGDYKHPVEKQGVQSIEYINVYLEPSLKYLESVVDEIAVENTQILI